MSKTLFRNDAAEFIYTRTYSRWKEDLQRRETWFETVQRYLDFIKKHVGDKVPEKVFRKIHEGVLSFNVLPSMRMLWSAGPLAELSPTAIYNCSASACDSPRCFSECLYILMCGTGYGFSVENKYVNQLPGVPNTIVSSGRTYVIEDTKVGWAESVNALVEALYSGEDLGMQYNKIRPYGTRLAVTGGRAGGPGTLAQLHSFIRQTFYGARGRKLTSLECHDIFCETAEIVTVGGVRRSSLISLSDLDDELMRNCKNGNFPIRRYMANNSAVYNSKPDIVTFMKEWSNLIASRSGERGIFNLEAVRNMSPKRRNAELITGTNPCGEIMLRSNQFCVSGDTQLITKESIVTIKDVINSTIEIWNGNSWSKVTPKETGNNQKLFRITFTDGSYLDCTEYHRFSVKNRFQKNFKEIPLKDLDKGRYSLQLEPFTVENSLDKVYTDAYTLGFAVGDGNVYKEKLLIPLFGEKKNCPVSGKRGKQFLPKGGSVSGIPVSNCVGVCCDKVRNLKTIAGAFDELFSWSRVSVLDFVAGMADSDGSETGTGGIRIYLSKEDRARRLQLLLTKNGVKSSVNLMSKKGEITNKGTRNEDIWYLQITECSELPCHRLDCSKGHCARFKGKYQNVRSIESLPGTHTVYCFEENVTHKAVFNNVLTFQCNLSEVVVRHDDDIDSLLEKVETATWMGIIQSCFTDFEYLRPEWKRNCDEERLLGVSLTGQMDAPQLLSEESLKSYKTKAIRVSKKASSLLGIPMPAAISCVKPSGTVGQLADCASGVHPRFSKYYIRRYRISGVDPLLRMIRDQGLPVSPENGQTDWPESKVNTWVVSFPVAAPKGCITVDDVTALEQLEWYKKLQKNWCEHNASITVYVRPHEWLKVGDWVYENWNIVNGVSFLPLDDHIYQQAPYEKITKEQYDSLIKTFPKIDYSQLSRYEQEDNTEGARTLACTGGQCEL